MTKPAARTAPGSLARGTVLAAASLTIMAPAIIAPSLPAMEQAFGAGLVVRLAMTLTSLMIGISAPLAGLLADRIGRRPVLVAALLLYALAGTAGFFVTDLPVLLVTRALLGVAVGGVMTAVTATITDWFDGPDRASFLGLQQAFASLGGVVFLPLAGVLATLGWRVPFWLYAVAAVVALLAIAAVHDRPRPPGLRTGSKLPGRALGIYAVALAATLVFYMGPTQVPFLLTAPALVGFVVAGSTLSSAVAAFSFPALRRRLRSPVITAVSIGLLGLGWVVVGLAGDAVGAAVGLLVGGTGVGFAVPNLTLRLSELASPERRGRVLSGLVTAIFLGQFFSPLLVEPVVHAVGVGGAFWWAGFAATASAVLGGVFSSKGRKFDDLPR
ncbi:MFS transporter [Amycolatopsis jejuensis]|uniref:MFS transporter n=1 Tax=Amycolatopsis jejuensis TaxID=330084 RepID=UPI0005252D70|nr:MFS transporter [Amycolatopsis jejuensis]